MKYKYTTILAALAMPFSLLCSCGDDKKDTGGNEKAETKETLSRKDKLEAMDGFKFFIGTAFV